MYIFLVELINLAFSEVAAYIYCFLIGVAIGYYLAKIINKKKEFFYKKLMPKDFCQNGLCKILPDFSALRIGAPAEQFRNEVKE